MSEQPTTPFQLPSFQLTSFQLTSPFRPFIEGPYEPSLGLGIKRPSIGGWVLTNGSTNAYRIENNGTSTLVPGATVQVTSPFAVFKGDKKVAQAAWVRYYLETGLKEEGWMWNLNF